MIGKTIQEKRKAAGYTQAQLAERLGVTAPAVNRWEKDLSYPDATLLAPLARLLNIDMNELFSFYASLSDTERDLLISRFSAMMMDGTEADALNYIDSILRDNPSDGLLHKMAADVLYGQHVLRRVADEKIYLDRIIPYYERAMELSPEYTEDISNLLLSIYGTNGEQEKAEEALARIPERKYDKEWLHAELLYTLKQYTNALPEMKRQILIMLVDLSVKLDILQDTFENAGHHDMAQLTQEKNAAFRELFELWNGFDALSNIISANANRDADGMMDSLNQLVTSQAGGQRVSNCPLFSDTSVGSAEKGEKTTADLISDIIAALGDLEGRD